MNVIAATKSLQDVAAETGKPLILFGRFMLPDRSEYPCRLRNISIRDAEIVTDENVETGTRIVAYVDEIGRIEGIVTGHMPDGFVMALKLTSTGRERIPKRLQWLRDRALGRNTEQRRHERFVPKETRSAIMLADGRSYPCEIIDISLSGASVRTGVLPEIGMHVRLGRTCGRVVRHHEEGIAVEFVHLMQERELRERIGGENGRA